MLLSREMGLAVLRQVLQLAGGALIARGTLDAGTWELLAGAVVSLATAGWMILAKRQAAAAAA